MAQFKPGIMSIASKDGRSYSNYPWMSRAFDFPIWMPARHRKILERIKTEPGMSKSKLCQGPFDPGGQKLKCIPGRIPVDDIRIFIVYKCTYVIVLLLRSKVSFDLYLYFMYVEIMNLLRT